MSTLLPAIPLGGVVPAPSLAVPGQLPPKRNRTQLSCTHCRHAKLKCDRKLPCLPCIKKGRAVQCTFPAPATRKKPAESMQSRLRHLESLVKDAMNSQIPASNGNVPEYARLHGMANDVSVESKPNLGVQTQATREVQPPFGPMKMATTEAVDSGSSGQVIQSVKETTYVGATHWAAILEDIEEVKSYFNETESEDYNLHDGIGNNLAMLFKFEPHATKEDLLEALPPRGNVDKLVFRVFNSNSSTQHVIHKPTFQKEYDRFWTDPSGTPLSWLAQLYALMTLGAMSYLWAGQASPDATRPLPDMIRAYRTCSAQGLVLSNYAQPGPHTIEAFIIYMESEFLLSTDDKVHCFLLVGSVVRLAFRMGLHRDPSKMRGAFTPFQAEIRRRVWHVLQQIDLLAGFHLGLPSMIQSVESDTEYPWNLKDDDFYEDIAELPPSRPESDPTPVLYLIAKSRICEVFAKIGAQANRVTPLSYDETLKLDEQLNESFAKVPPHLRCMPLGLSVTDSSDVIMQRFNLALLYYRNLCVLHRRYLIKEREHHEYAYSKKAGLEASMEILSCQSAINEAVQPGGPLVNDKWYISSLPMHDFLLAATILSILVLQMVGENTAGQTHKDPSKPTQQEMINALERSYSIWRQMQDISPDTKKAFGFLGSLLKKIRLAMAPINGLHNTGNINPFSINDFDPSANLISGLSMHDSIQLAQNQTPSYTPSWPSDASGSTPFTTNTQLGSEPMSIPTEDLGSLLDMATDFDWVAFDAHVRQQYQLPEETWQDSMFDGV